MIVQLDYMGAKHIDYIAAAGVCTIRSRLCTLRWLGWSCTRRRLRLRGTCLRGINDHPIGRDPLFFVLERGQQFSHFLEPILRALDIAAFVVVFLDFPYGEAAFLSDLLDGLVNDM